jgi:hypothetical protein
MKISQKTALKNWKKQYIDSRWSTIWQYVKDIYLQKGNKIVLADIYQN